MSQRPVKTQATKTKTSPGLLSKSNDSFTMSFPLVPLSLLGTSVDKRVRVEFDGIIG